MLRSRTVTPHKSFVSILIVSGLLLIIDIDTLTLWAKVKKYDVKRGWGNNFLSRFCKIFLKNKVFGNTRDYNLNAKKNLVSHCLIIALNYIAIKWRVVVCSSMHTLIICKKKMFNFSLEKYLSILVTYFITISLFHLCQG